jgi:glycosyltransferase A (GT-A) superfamily protein (DUF2064 family)
MAKAPRAGVVKTRLCPPCTPHDAAAVAASALADTLDAALATDRPVVLALDGPPGPWERRDLRVVAQVGATFAERLARAWAHLPAGGVQIGMDTPQCTPALLLLALDAVHEHGSALGPATDGGWWLIGLERPHPMVFERVVMSTPTTGRDQLRRMRALGLSPAQLPTLTDIDTWPDARTVAEAIPDSRTARTVARVAGALEVRA